MKKNNMRGFILSLLFPLFVSKVLHDFLFLCYLVLNALASYPFKLACKDDVLFLSFCSATTTSIKMKVKGDFILWSFKIV